MRLANRVSGQGRIRSASVPLTTAGFSQAERGATFPFREAVPTFRAILFADLKGFRALPGDHYLAFYEVLHQLLSRAIETAGERPILDTWGDGVHAAFGDVVAAARFAWALCELAAREDWPALEMPAATNFRVALGAGTVLIYRDPLLDRLVCRGPVITHTARIEPVTPPGSVWTSRSFAARIESTPGHDFTCRSLGRKALAKGSDRPHLYLLSRESEKPGIERLDRSRLPIEVVRWQGSRRPCFMGLSRSLAATRQISVGFTRSTLQNNRPTLPLKSLSGRRPPRLMISVWTRSTTGVAQATRGPGGRSQRRGGGRCH
jgi:class 3 adenylate cyclase